MPWPPTTDASRCQKLWHMIKSLQRTCLSANLREKQATELADCLARSCNNMRCTHSFWRYGRQESLHYCNVWNTEKYRVKFGQLKVTEYEPHSLVDYTMITDPKFYSVHHNRYYNYDQQTLVHVKETHNFTSETSPFTPFKLVTAVSWFVSKFLPKDKQQ